MKARACRRAVVHAAVVWATVLAACEQSVTIVPDSTAGTGGGGPGGGGGGNALRATLNLVVLAATDDSGVVRRLGWPGPGIPYADVVIARDGQTGRPFAGATDSLGRVRFDTLLEGTYHISVLRLIAPGERSLLDSSDSDILGFGGGLTLQVRAPETDSSFNAAAGRRGSLVISEFQFNAIGTLNAYRYSGYLELYNNSDTTVYLDGKILGAGYDQTRELPVAPCDLTEVFRNDPRGIRARWFYRFPGGGRDHPLAPGRTVVVATDAIDHSVIIAGGLDLRTADFEFYDEPDVDNPSVPNMIAVGTTGGFSLGHGLYWHFVDDFVWVSEPLNVSLLQVDLQPLLPAAAALPAPYALIPAERLLDLAVFLISLNVDLPYCALLIAPNLDRQPGTFLGPEGFDGRSIQRKVLSTTPFGPLLLRTKTTARDFEIRPISPGSVP